MPLPKILSKLSVRGRIGLAGAVLGVVVVLFVMFKLASSPGYTTIVTGLDPAQTGKMTTALDEKGVAYELQNNGTALAVEKRDVANARIALAEQGGVAGGTVQPGFELFDNQKMGSSQMQQQVTYQRAMEGELAKTIGQIQGVSGASVQLVLPDDTDALLSENAPEATAAVLLSGAEDPEPAAVQGIARLVASSVKSLKPSKVTITDGAGRLLWPTAGADGAAGGTGTGGAALAKQAAAQKYQTSLEGSLSSVLAQTLGPNMARVRVNADIDADQATQEQLQYGRKRVALKTKTDNERMRGTGATNGGTAGTAGNVPGYAATAGGGGNSNYQHESGESEFGNDKTVTKRTIAAGAVNRQSVSVLVSNAVPAAQLPAIRQAIAAAAGINTQRGDQLNVSRIAFAQAPAAPKASPLSGNVLDYAKWAAVALATIIFLVLVARHLRRREREALASPTWLNEIEAPLPLREFVPEPAPVPVRVAPAVLDVAEPPPARKAIQELAERDPGRVANQVRHWLSED
ncbi:flagellar basal-body MS-ring/collar protein FliF [Patulibacter sp. SYSU D01012]|uniref:flagellar basal-body MS-ring/collar protein FliF n=1 Tax=Patulibacter sp. SYSU D01012 TaxID=2817381 RepID=UPI001B30B4AC